MAAPGPFLVTLAHDGAEPPPAAMAATLARRTAEADVGADYYSNGGAVAALEARIARLLGKERAVMVSTGTLANFLAVRRLAGPGGCRVVVHRESHLFNDAGDNLARLGGDTLVPLAGEGAGFSAGQLEAEFARTGGARVADRVGCVCLETPNRRLLGARFPEEDRATVIDCARAHGVPVFLDGARLLIEAAWTDRDPAALAAPADIVYLSLYKYLDAPFGCVLAGPAALLDDLYHDRRRYGGGLYQMWPAAVLADVALDGHLERWRAAIPAAEATLAALAALPAGLTVERIPLGTNVVVLRRPGRPFDPAALKAAAAARALALPAPENDRLTIKINETWTRLAPDDLASRVAEAVQAA